MNFRVSARADVRLISDRLPVAFNLWCDCHRTRFAEARFHVIFPGGCDMSGTVHAARTCRRLLSLT